jgi:hypothetical protein
MKIKKAQIVAALRSRGQQDRADWVDKTLPELVDTETNGSILQTLNIDLSSMSPDEAGSLPG